MAAYSQETCGLRVLGVLLAHFRGLIRMVEIEIDILDEIVIVDAEMEFSEREFTAFLNRNCVTNPFG